MPASRWRICSTGWDRIGCRSYRPLITRRCRDGRKTCERPVSANTLRVCFTSSPVGAKTHQLARAQPHHEGGSVPWRVARAVSGKCHHPCLHGGVGPLITQPSASRSAGTHWAHALLNRCNAWPSSPTHHPPWRHLPLTNELRKTQATAGELVCQVHILDYRAVPRQTIPGRRGWMTIHD